MLGLCLSDEHLEIARHKRLAFNAWLPHCHTELRSVIAPIITEPY
jgi:hypothetical protein